MDQPVLRAPMVIRNSAIHRGPPVCFGQIRKGQGDAAWQRKAFSNGSRAGLRFLPRDCPAICKATGCYLDGEGQEDCDSVAGIAAHKAAKSTPTSLSSVAARL
jgi:hypothetical protein